MKPVMLDDLVARFRDKSRSRLSEMETLLDDAARHPGWGKAIQRLAHHFHGLSGLGGTYGYPEISTLGDEGEAILAPLVKSKRGPSPEELEQLRTLVRNIRRALET